MAKNNNAGITKENVARLNATRDTTEIDMVDIVGRFLEDFVSPEAANGFLTNINIILVKSATQGVQRVAINRYFATKLLIFRAESNISVMDQMLYLVNDGETNEWFDLFRSFIIPFLKKHSIK